jgi:hypothetical protein
MPMPLQDLAGLKFGRLRVIEAQAPAPNGERRWLCCCACGRQVVVNGSNLRRGRSRSCGCLSKGGRAQVVRRLATLARRRAMPSWQMCQSIVMHCTAWQRRPNGVLHRRIYAVDDPESAA